MKSLIFTTKGLPRPLPTPTLRLKDDRIFSPNMSTRVYDVPVFGINSCQLPCHAAIRSYYCSLSCTFIWVIKIPCRCSSGPDPSLQGNHLPGASSTDRLSAVAGDDNRTNTVPHVTPLHTGRYLWACFSLTFLIFSNLLRAGLLVDEF